MYKWNTKIRYSECGDGERLTLPGIINYFQDCSSANSENLGVGINYLREKRRAWVLNSWQIEVYRYPRIEEEIEVSTWATGFKAVFGPRNFCMKTKAGEMLACANTLWVYVDIDSGRPLKPDEEEKSVYSIEPPLEMENVSRKIKLPEGADIVDTIQVRKYHIDTNKHMNNCQYVQIAMEVVPDDFQTKKLRVEYKKSAVYGDIIVIKRAIEEERLVVELCDQEEIPYAVVEFIGEQ